MATRLTQKRLKQVLSYDFYTGIFTWNIYKKCVRKGDIAGRVESNGYSKIGIDYKSYLSHRLAWFYVYGYWPGVIDHIDRNRSNNAIDNLREVTPAENLQNMGITKRNTTGHVGVSFRPERNKYHAQICANGKRIHLGYFETAELAGMAYLSAKQKYHINSDLA